MWDTGVGIAESDLGRIFDEFVQLGNPERDRRKGLGLGLSIARRSVALLGSGIEVLTDLKTPMGRFAVLGNHDNRVDPCGTRAVLAEHGIRDLSNKGLWLERGGARLWLCGVEDHTTSREDYAAALGNIRTSDACIMLSHNPDSVEDIRDPRVGLVLSGHTHGGQVVLPFVGAPVVPSSYGQKYLSGFVQGPVTRVYISRGVGTIAPPVRFRCPPEVTLITLSAGGPVRKVSGG